MSANLSGSASGKLGQFGVERSIDAEALKASLQSAARYFGRPWSASVLFSAHAMPDYDTCELFIERVLLEVGLTADRIEAVGGLLSRQDLYPALLLTNTGSFLFIATTADLSRSNISVKSVDAAWQVSQHYSNNEDRAATGAGDEIERPNWLIGPIRKFWRGYINIIVAAFFINLLALASPIFIMNVYDRILPNKATSSLLALALGVGIAIVFDYILKYLRSVIIDDTGRSIDLEVSHSLFEKVVISKLSERPASTGEYASRVNQIDFVREFFTSNTITALIDAFFVFVFLFVIYLVGGWLFVIPLVAFLLALVLGLVAQYKIGKRVARAANEAARRQSLLVETISTLETVKSLRAEAQLIKKWDNLTNSSSKTSEEIKHISANSMHLIQMIQQLVSVAIVIGGAFEFAAGNITTGAIIATVMLSGRTIAPMGQIAMTLARFKQATLSLRILNQIMAQAEDRPSKVGFVDREIASGSLVLEDVTFNYPGTDVNVLQKVNLRIQPGERVGIIGKIGSGKTTLGRLLNGLYDVSGGRILADGIDIRQFHPAMLRDAIAYTGQSVDLFAGTLKENLLLANPAASDAELIAAAKLTGVDEFASQHPRGYDLAVGEHGNNLSGGQKQSVALTRLLLSKPKIVFLDEPSGALDMATERQLIGNLSGAFGADVTLIISTHRYSLLELVNRLVVIDRGKIIADGPKQKVLDALSARAQAAQAGH